MRFSAKRYSIVQAANKFRSNATQQSGLTSEAVRVESSNGVVAFNTGVDCPQELLDEVVKSLYTRELTVKSETVADILSLADFLQVHSIHG